jgi:hypothetical protein
MLLFMKRIFLNTVLAIALLAPGYTKAQMAYTLSNGNEVYTTAGENGHTSGPYSVSGVTHGQLLLALDRGADGNLYALGYDYASGMSQLYTIDNPNNVYTATAVGDAYAGINLTQDNIISSFAFVPGVPYEIKLTDAHNNSYIINSQDGTISDIGNELVNQTVDPTVNGGLLLYPNPVTSNARIILPAAAANNVFVDVLDMNGHILRSFEYGKGTFQLDMDMSVLPVGLYSVRVSQAGVPLENLKVVKN